MYATRSHGPEACLLSFPPFRLDLDAEQLWRGDKEVQLRRKPFAILRYLAQNPQRLVTQAELVEAVWGKIAMSESLLRTHVHDLRGVLGEGIIDTVVGRGYRFAAEIEHAYADDHGPRGNEEPPRTVARCVVGRDREIAATEPLGGDEQPLDLGLQRARHGQREGDGEGQEAEQDAQHDQRGAGEDAAGGVLSELVARG